MDFLNTPQQWDNAGAKPTDILVKEGFKAGYKPPAAYFNYLFNNYYKCIEEIQNVVGTKLLATPKIKYIETTLAASGWQSDSGEVYYDIDTKEAEAQRGNVYFSTESLPDAIEAGVKPVTSCSDGIIRVYAERMPGKALTATVEIVKEGW